MGEICTTTWQPDTCGCIVEYTWDRETDETNRVHTFKGHSKRCSDHEHLWDQDVYDCVLEENQRKNITLAHAAEQTTLGHDVERKDRGRKTTFRQLKPDVKHNFFFTHQGDQKETSVKNPRLLHLTFSEQVSGEHKNKIELRFPGLIVVHQ